MEKSGQLHKRRFTPAEEPIERTNWEGGCVGPRAGMVAVLRTEISFPCREENSDNIIFGDIYDFKGQMSNPFITIWVDVKSHL